MAQGFEGSSFRNCTDFVRILYLTSHNPGVNVFHALLANETDLTNNINGSVMARYRWRYVVSGIIHCAVKIPLAN
jgi:hypothetical protein